jgi:hypothetical protein
MNENHYKKTEGCRSRASSEESNIEITQKITSPFTNISNQSDKFAEK